VAWGGGDFSGGMGAKATGGSAAGTLRMVLVADAVSLAVLLAVCLLRHAARPHGAPMLWALSAGVVAAFALTAFYVALARGAMGASAAVSGLLAAAIPAVVSSWLEGLPNLLKLAGFALAAAAIWMIAAGPPETGVPRRHARLTMALTVFAGVSFGYYFVALRMAEPLGVLEPLTLARTSCLVVCGLLLMALSFGSGKPAQRLGRAAIGWALGVALLDTCGNLLFLAATRMGRLDVAAVLASLYPAGTILLAAWYLKERPTRRQFYGMAVALAAVVMITV
jgi:drug/metabolite transporter (DMT)-like permease